MSVPPDTITGNPYTARYGDLRPQLTAAWNEGFAAAVAVLASPQVIEAGRDAIYAEWPMVRKDLIARWDAERGTGLSHGPGVPEKWLAEKFAAAVQASLLPEEKTRGA